MWHLPIEMKRRFPDMLIICDPSHICGNRTGLQAISQKSDTAAARLNAYRDRVFTVFNKCNNQDDAITKAKSHVGQGKPIVILMKTQMGAGIDFMMGSHKWHGVAPNDAQLQQALDQLPETLGDYKG